MKKSKRKRNHKKQKLKNTRKQVKPILNKSQTNRQRLFSLVLKIFFSIASLTSFIAGLIAIYFHFYPQIDISYSDPIASNNIFTSRFKIENDGNCNVYNVRLKYRLDRIRATTPSIEHLEINNFNLTYKRPIFERIRKNRKQSINLDFSQPISNFPTDMNTFNAELNIYLEYKYWKYFTKIDSFHFETSGMINNKIIWLDKQ